MKLWIEKQKIVQREELLKMMVRDKQLVECELQWRDTVWQYVTYDKVLRFCGQMSQLQVETFVYIITVSISMLRRSSDTVRPVSKVCNVQVNRWHHVTLEILQCPDTASDGGCPVRWLEPVAAIQNIFTVAYCIGQTLITNVRINGILNITKLATHLKRICEV